MDDADRLINPAARAEDADAALYRVKGRKRGHMRVFTPALRSSLRQHQDMERLLYAALPARQFHLFMQPAFSLRDSQLYCAEALLRWSPDPDTVLSPQHFLSRAESLGLTRKLDQWALETVCEMLRCAGPLAGSFSAVPVSVNISPASAMSQAPERRLSNAWQIATSEVEQAVCTLIAGPVRLSLCATRVAM